MLLASGLAITRGAILRVDQRHVGARRLQPLDAAMQQRTMRSHRIAAQERVGADLPQHEVGLLGDDARSGSGPAFPVRCRRPRRDCAPLKVVIGELGRELIASRLG